MMIQRCLVTIALLIWGASVCAQEPVTGASDPDALFVSPDPKLNANEQVAYGAAASSNSVPGFRRVAHLRLSPDVRLERTNQLPNLTSPALHSTRLADPARRHQRARLLQKLFAVPGCTLVRATDSFIPGSHSA